MCTAGNSLVYIFLLNGVDVSSTKWQNDSFRSCLSLSVVRFFISFVETSILLFGMRHAATAMVFVVSVA